MRKISQETQKEILNAYKVLKSISEVSKKFSVSKTTVLRILNRSKINIKTLKRGPKQKLSIKKENFLVREFEKKNVGSCSAAKKLLKENFNIDVSKESIRKILQKHDFMLGFKIKKPFLNKRHVVEILNFYSSHKKLSHNNWNKIIFSDESKFNLFSSDAGEKAWYKKNFDLIQVIYNLFQKKQYF